MSNDTITLDSSGKSSSRIEQIQDALLRRFSRGTKEVEPVVFEFTEDRGLLHQYYRLRDQIFGRDIMTTKVEGGEDIHDKISHILVARRGRLVIGACRLTVREGDEGFLLPMESEDFKLRTLFPELPLKGERHGVISKFAILEEHNERDILYGLCKIMYDRVIMTDVHYLFARATNYKLARNWRLLANSFGAKKTVICEDVDVPENPLFPGEKQYLCYSDISELCLKEFPRTPVPNGRKLSLIDKTHADT